MKLVTILILVSITLHIGYSQTVEVKQLSTTQKEAIDQLFADFDAEDSPGYAIGVFNKKGPLYIKGYGSANLDYNILISGQSVFNIASLSKQFTGACVAQLILDGRLSLDDSASTFFPELKQYPADIKIKHLVYMTSGLKEYYRLPRVSGLTWDPAEYFTIDTAITVSLAQNELDFLPGAKNAYSNINYMLLAKIVEQVSGQTLDAFAKERLFEPLGMKHTQFHIDPYRVVPQRVTGYNYRDEEKGKAAGFYQYHRNSPHYGGSGILTTVEDLGKWTINFFNKEKLGGQAFYDLMHQTMKFEHDRQNEGIGLGINEFNGMTIVQYSGGDQGFSSYMARFPDQGIAVVCLSNLGTGNTFRYGQKILDIVFYGKK